MVRCDFVVKTELWIEEIEVVVQLDVNHFVVRIHVAYWTIHLEVDVAILQVGKGTQSLGKFPVHLAIEVQVCFL